VGGEEGLEALKIEWDDGPNGKISSAQLWDELRLASLQSGVVARNERRRDKGLASGSRLDAATSFPLLAHATMEPMNCTVQVRAGGCEVWVGTQVVARVQRGCRRARACHSRR
jgi:isoquinoline 1-oxidoreductase beta subunit